MPSGPVNSGTPVIFHCYARGNPRPVIRWAYVTDAILSDKQDRQWLTEGNYSTESIDETDVKSTLRLVRFIFNYIPHAPYSAIH